MKLDSEFYRLPLKFDVERLKAELGIFNESDWMPHPSGFNGNSFIPLISVDGERNGGFSGRMKPTAALKKCPYIQQIISSFGEVFGRSRLMRLGPNAEVSEHSDINYHWFSRVRIHIPITTVPEVIFYCGDKSVHMAEGETWIFDSWKMHKVTNGADKDRIHLVIDTSGSSDFWDLVEQSDEPHNEIYKDERETKFLSFNKSAKINIQTENYNVPIVMSPGEVDYLCLDITKDASDNTNNSPDDLKIFIKHINDFRYNWRSVWSQFGPSEQGWPKYKTLINKLSQSLANFNRPIVLFSNRANAYDILNARVLVSCLNPPQQQPNDIKKNTKDTEKKPGRNSPCPCGSGKKYKHCHG